MQFPLTILPRINYICSIFIRDFYFSPTTSDNISVLHLLQDSCDDYAQCTTIILINSIFKK